MLNGKSAVITGGVRGIGRAIAEEFCRQGADVLLCYRSNEAAAKRTAEELKQYGTRVELVKGDVSDPAHAEETAKLAKELFGKIDVLETGDRVEITDSAFASLHGTIRKMDRRRQTLLVELDEGNAIKSVWLPYHLVEKS